jgi:Lipocalin-like domain
MKTILRSTLLVSTIAIALFACKDDDSNGPVNNGSPRADLLTAKSWKVTAVTIGGIDVFGSFDPCVKDDLFRFNKDGKMNHEDGTQKCSNPNVLVPQSGTWVLESNDTKLKTVSVFGNQTYTTLYTIEELNSTTLRVSYDQSGAKGEQTYTAQ